MGAPAFLRFAPSDDAGWGPNRGANAPMKGGAGGRDGASHGDWKWKDYDRRLSALLGFSACSLASGSAGRQVMSRREATEVFAGISRSVRGKLLPRNKGFKLQKYNVPPLTSRRNCDAFACQQRAPELAGTEQPVPRRWPRSRVFRSIYLLSRYFSWSMKWAWLALMQVRSPMPQALKNTTVSSADLREAHPFAIR